MKALPARRLACMLLSTVYTASEKEPSGKDRAREPEEPRAPTRTLAAV